MSNGSWEKIYSEQGEVQLEVLNTVVEAVDAFNRNGYKSVLDLGCGTGRNTVYLAQQGFQVTACDVSETGLEITKQKAKALGLNEIEYGVENMFNLSFNDETFDAVLCVWVQGHGTRREVQMGIDESYRVLKDNGMVVTDFVTVDDKTYGIGEEIEKDTFVGGRPGEEGMTHYYTTQEDLERMFGQFSKVDIYSRTYIIDGGDGKKEAIDALVVRARK